MEETAALDNRSTDGDDGTRITQTEVMRLLGNITAMTLWRWRQDPALNFPKPEMTFNGRNYYSRWKVLNWQPPLDRTKPKSKVRAKAAGV